MKVEYFDTNPDKNIIKKQNKTTTPRAKARPIPLMNLDTKIFNKILVKKI